MKILIVDDEKNIRLSLTGILKDDGFEPNSVSSGEGALEILEKEKFDIIFLDVLLPGMNGIEVLEKINAEYPDIYTIMISGHSDLSTAVQATKLGAYNFFEKPLQADKILLEIKNIESRKKLERDLKSYKEVSEIEEEIIGNSKELNQLKNTIKLAAPSDGRVMVFGENGTGKELVAKAIHFNSKRRDKPFVKINCAAIPKDLMESELFGYEKGAFTGAITRKIGRIEEADAGTLFLDEIGDMNLETQAKLLRVLEENEFVRLGGTKTIKFDIRVISATNKNLEEEIRKGTFREDLYFRLKVIPVNVPSLSRRKDDIPLLVDHFSKIFAIKNGKKTKTFSKEAIEILKKHRWPGNIRELKNLVERAIIMINDDTITSEYLSNMLPEVQTIALKKENTGDIKMEGDFKNIMDDFQKTVLQEKYNQCGGNISKMAKELDIDRANLHRKLKKYGIK